MRIVVRGKNFSMNGGQINLKCSDFLANIFSSFNALEGSDLFTDVTIVSDDNRKILAHKVILSAGSEFFRDILSDKAHPHPMLCLDGVSSDDLEWIIKYLYVGEVSVPKSSLTKFLKIANKLKCFGLLNSTQFLNEEEYEGSETKETENKWANNEISQIERNIEDHIQEPVKDAECSLSENDIVDIWDEGAFLLEDEAEPENTNDAAAVLNEEGKVIGKERCKSLLRRRKILNKASYSEFCRIDGKTVTKDQFKEYLKEQYQRRDHDKSFKCYYCKKIDMNIGHMEDHVQRHLKNLEFDCQNCGMVLPRSYSLRRHRCEITGQMGPV